MGLYGVVKSLGMGCGVLWGREVSGNGERRVLWGHEVIGIGDGALWGREVSGIGDGTLWGREVSGNGVWGSMGS